MSSDHKEDFLNAERLFGTINLAVIYDIADYIIRKGMGVKVT